MCYSPNILVAILSDLNNSGNRVFVSKIKFANGSVINKPHIYAISGDSESPTAQKRYSRRVLWWLQSLSSAFDFHCGNKNRSKYRNSPLRPPRGFGEAKRRSASHFDD
jgi:hypothetical protein